MQLLPRVTNKTLGRLWTQLAKIINGNVEMYYYDSNGNPIQGNIQGYLFKGTISTPNTDFVITHDLGFVPLGFIPINLSANSNIWVTGTSSTTITVRVSAAVDVVLMVI